MCYEDEFFHIWKSRTKEHFEIPAKSWRDSDLKKSQLSYFCIQIGIKDDHFSTEIYLKINQK